MSSIVFADKEPAELPPALAQITAGAFWPPVNLVDVRAAVRIDHTVTHERLHYAATAAVVYVNQQLAAFQAAMLQKGIAALVQISPQAQINGITVAEHHYRRAVYSYTKAELLETYADYDATGKSADRAEAKQEQADDYRREAHGAIADLLGRPRTTVELI